jgi:hypothetical protein
LYRPTRTSLPAIKNIYSFKRIVFLHANVIDWKFVHEYIWTISIFYTTISTSNYPLFLHF